MAINLSAMLLHYNGALCLLLFITVSLYYKICNDCVHGISFTQSVN